MENSPNKIRVDKWLWAARFFRTRALAKKAIEGGKIHCDGVKVKASKDLCIGQTLKINQSNVEKIVVIKMLSGQRGDAKKAALLYEETQESIEKRALMAAQRKALGGMMPTPAKRPDKRNRRLIHQFKQGMQDDD